MLSPCMGLICDSSKKRVPLVIYQFPVRTEHQVNFAAEAVVRVRAGWPEVNKRTPIQGAGGSRWLRHNFIGLEFDAGVGLYHADDFLSRDRNIQVWHKTLSWQLIKLLRPFASHQVGNFRLP